MLYKYSLYNNIVNTNDESGNVYIWNTKSGAIVSLEEDIYKLISDNIFENQLIKPLINDLLVQGIIVPAQLNEFNQICFVQKQIQYSTNYDTLNLIIAPTLQCNYRCVYCFEESQTQKTIMSSEIIENIVTFVERYISHITSVKRLEISWFGGEPLMAYHTAMYPLGKKLIELSKKHGISFNSKITTNGFYLEDGVIESIVDELKVSSFQITFDGTCENYCLRKGVSVVAYEKVKRNLFSLSQYLAKQNSKAHISLRINVDNDNIEDAKALVREIKSDDQFNDNIHFYLGRLMGYCGDLNYMSLEEYEQSEMEFCSFMGTIIKPKEPKKIWCGQFAMNNLCIGPNGEIYKCEHDFGYSDRTIGHVLSGVFYNERMIEFLEQPYPAECKKCSVFPICLGGCPSARFSNKKHMNCEYTTRYLVRLVEQYIENGRRKN